MPQRTWRRQKAFKQPSLDAVTIMVSCGVTGFEDAEYSNVCSHEMREYLEKHMKGDKIAFKPGIFKFDAEVRKMFQRSPQANYP